MGRSKLMVALGGALVLTVVSAALLVSIFERQQAAKANFFRVVEVRQDEPDPEIWGRNYRAQYDAYIQSTRTADLMDYEKAGRYAGPAPFSRLEWDPYLRRLFAGYPFALEYNEDRGHMQAIEDVKNTRRLGDTKPGSCFTCKSSAVPSMMATLGGPERFYATPMKDLLAQFDPKHPISCADCHDADSMALRISRPAFSEAMAARGVDLSKATRQEMRSYVCAQCHVEYYFEGDGKYVVFPWSRGLNIDNIETYYEEINFKDWEHAETKTALVKIQHPDFELWSSGVHARAGVSCADCHMSYKRDGAAKITDHWIKSPLFTTTNSCSTCHRVSEEELKGRVLEIQDRTHNLMQRTEKAILDAQDALKAAVAREIPDSALQRARGLHRRAYIRWDFVAAESSMGFHSPQEAARILGDSVDLARQAELAALQAMGEAAR